MLRYKDRLNTLADDICYGMHTLTKINFKLVKNKCQVPYCCYLKLNPIWYLFSVKTLSGVFVWLSYQQIKIPTKNHEKSSLSMKLHPNEILMNDNNSSIGIYKMKISINVFNEKH